MSNYKALEYFITTKALTTRQAYQTKILSQYNFQIIYKPRATNYIDALTRQEQDIDNQIATKITLHNQILLGPKRLDPRILAKLLIDQYQNLEMCLIEILELDFIDELLQANCTTNSLQKYHEDAKDNKSRQTLENRLLKHQEQLVVPRDQNLQTRLIAKAHCQVSIAYLGQNKTRCLIRSYYYQPRISKDLDCYITNCYTCYKLIAL